MASKNTQFHDKPDSVSVKWVKKAQMWCRTTVVDNKQTQEWFNEKPKISTVEEDTNTEA